MHATTSISYASSIAMAIEQKLKFGGQKFDDGMKGEGSRNGPPKKDSKKMRSTSTANTNKYCDHCKIEGHTKDKYWKATPTLFPKK